MGNEVSITDFIRALQARVLLVVLVVAGCAGIGFYASQKMTPWYAHSFLIKSGSLNDTPAIEEKLLPTTAPKSDLKAEFIAYLNYEYLNNKLYLEKKDIDAYLNSVEDVASTDFIGFKVYGLTLEKAKAHGEEIFKHIQKRFSERIALELESKKKELAAAKDSKNMILDSLKEIALSQKTFGKNETLDKKRIEMETRLSDLNLEIIKLEKTVDSDDIRQFTIVSSRPETQKVAFPDPVLFTIGGAAAGMVLSSIILFMLLLAKPDNHYRAPVQALYPQNNNSYPPSHSPELGNVGPQHSDGQSNGSYRARR